MFFKMMSRFTWVVCLCIPATFIQAAESKGVYELSYSGRLNDDKRAKAYNAAKFKAVEAWIAKTQQYQMKNFELFTPTLTSKVDDYLLSSQLVSKRNNKDDNLFRVVMRVDINEHKLLDALTQTGRREKAQSTQDDQYITFVFVARELVSRTEVKSTQAGDFDRAKTRWQATTTNEIDTVVSAVFSEANYYVIDAALLEEETQGQLDVNNFIMDYELGDDLTPTTKLDAVRGLKGLTDPVQYLAIGTLDVDEHTKDTVSGLYKVSVAVTAKILAIQRRGATIASIEPVQFSGLGPTPIVAKNNALKLAARKMANGLIGQLSGKSI